MKPTLALLCACILGCAVSEAPDHAMTMRDADVGTLALCHVAGSDHHTIVVAAAAIEAHLAHGDTVGECALDCTSSDACEDGNACTNDVCTPGGGCAHTAVDCNDGNECTIDSCDPVGGCIAAAAEGNPCDDGNECTDDDVCCLDMCRGTPIAGCCDDASDCDDDNACSDDECIDHACSNTPVACADADEFVVGFCDPTTGECDGAPRFTRGV
jgi:slime mold repeat-containing protein